MKIAVPSLRQGRHVFETSSPPREYEELPGQSGLDFRGEIGVRAVVDKMGEDLFVRAEVTAQVKAECARCLSEFEIPLRGVFEALYVPEQQLDMAGPAAHRAEGQSQRILYYSGGVADLGEQIVEELVLLAPMKPLCRADCKGLCASCGKNLNEGSCGCKQGAAEFNRPFKGLFGRS